MYEEILLERRQMTDEYKQNVSKNINEIKLLLDEYEHIAHKKNFLHSDYINNLMIQDLPNLEEVIIKKIKRIMG